MTERFHKHKIENLIAIPKIVTIHYLEFDKNFVFAGEAHDFWEMVYVDKNEAVCRAEDDEFTVSAGHAVFHKPNEFHAVAANGVTPPNLFVITFECKSDAMRYFEGKVLRIPPDLKHLIKSIVAQARQTFKMDRQNPQLRKLELQSTPALGGQQLIRLYLETFLIRLLTSENEKHRRIFIPTEEFENTLVARVVAELRSHLHQALTLERLCERVHYSKPFLCKVFLAQTGQTIMQYYARLKIDAAKLMLREHQKSLNEIAEALGFTTLSYFCKVFKKHTAMTPGQYLHSVGGD